MSERPPVRGAHLIQFAENADAARAFYRDVLGWTHVDAGDGFLIFTLPPAELASHPTENLPPSGQLQLYLMCDDLDETMRALRDRGVEFTGEVTQASFGRFVSLRVPGAGEIGLYQPAHPTAVDA